jgi:3-isopropylmalate dehydrogenase
MKKVIAITKGDGVGPEVVNEGIKILNIISKYSDFEFEFKDAPAGGAVWKHFGTNLPKKSFEFIKSADAVLFGAVGLPDLPPGTAESAILKLRQELDLYVNLRPVKLFESMKNRCPLKDEFIGSGIDITFVRENTEGLYANKGALLSDEKAENLMIYTRTGCERVIKFAFEHAKTRRHKKITSVDKANLLYPSKLWRKIFHEIAESYPMLDCEDIYIDAFCQWLIRTPYKFETVVTGNLFGDIISDEGAFLIGSLGMASSGNINPGNVSVYEPIHGSAPDIAGKNIANPIGTILSVKLMVQESFENQELASEIENAVEKSLFLGRTKDIQEEGFKTLTTIQMGDIIAQELKMILKA